MLQGESLGAISVGSSINTVVRFIFVTDWRIRFKGGYSSDCSINAIRMTA